MNYLFKLGNHVIVFEVLLDGSGATAAGVVSFVKSLSPVRATVYGDMSTKHDLEYFALAHICPLCGYAA